MHICRCLDPGRDAMFRFTVAELCSWITETLGDMSVGATGETYLLACGRSRMSDCVHGNSTDLVLVASLSDRLGWDSFIKGQISTHWLIVVAPFLR